jgi:hypothetical protein
MTKLFEQAIARLRQLPETIQDRAARALMLQLEEEPEPLLFAEMECPPIGVSSVANNPKRTLLPVR